MPATGYRVYMKAEEDLVHSMIYNGPQSASIFTYIASNLTTGALYSFIVSAVNFNGEGPTSDPVLFTACTEPTGLKAPKVVLTSETTIDLVWNAPDDDGGCALIGFELMVDNGLGSAFVNADPSIVQYKPFLRSHSLNFLPSMTGRTFRIYLRAVNQIGFIESSLINVVLAGVPRKPSSAPSTILSKTTSKSLYVQYTAPEYDGGSAVLTYELQMDDGKGGDFISLMGFKENYLKLWYIVEGNITKGKLYRFRYRT